MVRILRLYAGKLHYNYQIKVYNSPIVFLCMSVVPCRMNYITKKEILQI